MPMDPDAQRLMSMIALAGRPPLHTLPPAEARTVYRQTRRAIQGPPPDVAAVRELDAGGVPARFYCGHDAAAGRGVLYLHGGGWVLGGLDSHDNVCRALANAGQCRVVAVDYRLAPEHRYPAAIEDAAAALAHVVAHAAALEIDPDQIAVAGDSAGGTLAAQLAIRGRDGAGPPLCQQVLLYPATDLACAHPSYDLFTQGVPLTDNGMRWFRDHYLGSADPGDPAVSPLRANLAGLPPAFVLTVGYDPLCDEGVAYAHALEQAGVAVTHLHLASQVHGFLTMDRMIRAAMPVLDMAGAALRMGWRAAP